MSLLVCPNCQVEMKMIARDGIEFDMCANCGSVWLEKKELEKMTRIAHEHNEYEKRTSNEKKKRAQFWVDFFDIDQ